MREFAQIQSRIRYMFTGVDTVWLYPLKYIEEALTKTTIPHTWDGINIVCPTQNDVINLYYEIYLLTAIAQPYGNEGYSLGVGTLLQDYGREIYFKTIDGSFFIHWRNVKQLYSQTTPPVNVPGNSPNNTIGFVTVGASYNNNQNPAPQILDNVLIYRLG
jgi:hypothetical protein